jgi:hypothetical protein
MPFNIKMNNESGLCGTCRHAFITRGDGLSQHVIICERIHPAPEVRFIVRTCSDYQERNKPSEYDMEKIGWVLEVKGGKVIGFRPPKKPAEDEGDRD